MSVKRIIADRRFKVNNKRSMVEIGYLFFKRSLVFSARVTLGVSNGLLLHNYENFQLVVY